MENQKNASDVILKKEIVGYIKSKLSLTQGVLCMTQEKIYLESSLPHRGVFGFFSSLGKHHNERHDIIFDLEYANIFDIKQGQYVVQSNVLEITNRNKNKFRVIVNDYKEWENAIKQKLTSYVA
ncbi:MAG: hypothetical protein WCQ95_07105 [Bacteroidota bacterium]